MISAGVDLGAKTIKIVILQNEALIAQALVMAGHDIQDSLIKAWEMVLKKSGIEVRQINRIAATGAGRKKAEMAHDQVPEVAAAARGVFFLNKKIRTVIDIGAEEGRAINLNDFGRVFDFAVNERCAAGTGAFIEAMARSLEVTLEDLGPLSLRSTQSVAINAQCVVFAESELVSLVHAKTPKEDIARAVHDAIADRVAAMVRRVGMEKEVMLIGGMAKNVGFIDSLKRELGTDILIPGDPEWVSALGAALMAKGN